MLLGVNVDHVATLRQARYRSGPGAGGGYGEPDIVPAAHAAILGGADCITVHLREDRRHVIDRDVELLRQTVAVKFNLEMAGTAFMRDLALRLRVHQVTLVPEGREEVTTEGGLAVAGREDHWKRYLEPLRAAGIMTSAFITPEVAQVQAAATSGFDAIELHTGAAAHALAGSSRVASHDPAVEQALGALERATETAGSMRVHAGHAMNYENVPLLLERPTLRGAWKELHIGHSIVSRAVFVGLERAVRDMKDLMR